MVEHSQPDGLVSCYEYDRYDPLGTGVQLDQYADRETGLRYNLLRFYDSISGRFINQDPIRLFGGENFYHFAFNAQSWIDPLGLEHVESYKRHLKKKVQEREKILLLQGKSG